MWLQEPQRLCSASTLSHLFRIGAVKQWLQSYLNVSQKKSKRRIFVQHIKCFVSKCNSGHYHRLVFTCESGLVAHKPTMHCTALAYHTKDIEPFFQKRVIRWNVKAKVDIFMHKISLKLKLKLSEADKYVTKFKWNISVHIKALNEYENKIFLF